MQFIAFIYFFGFMQGMNFRIFKILSEKLIKNIGYITFILIMKTIKALIFITFFFLHIIIREKSLH